MNEPILAIEGTGVPLPMKDIDTDQIMPKQFLKRVERSGFGPFIFHERRRSGDFVLDDPRYAEARVLVAGRNFGCGSSREQAVWGLLEAGFGAVVAPSFAPIFRANAARARLLTVELDAAEVRTLSLLVEGAPRTVITIDIAEGRLRAGVLDARFALDRRTSDAFILGVDEIERTLARDRAIVEHERQRAPWLPTTSGSTRR